MSSLTDSEIKTIFKLIVISSTFIFATGFIAFKMKSKKDPNLTLKEFLGFNKKLDIKNLSIWMLAGMIFGFLDSIGLWFGIDSLEPLLNKKFGISDTRIVAGYSNTFGMLSGSIFGVFVAVILSEIHNVNLDDAPIWANSIGIVIGCILGVQVGRLVSI